MKKRHKNLVCEAGDGITFKISEGTSGEIIIRAMYINNTDYVKPPIPKGYKYVCGSRDSGFVIERCSDGSQFVWIPVDTLEYNGTLDGKKFSEQFGRRDWDRSYGEFSDAELYEPLDDELIKQIESVKKYGGFYISRYNISISSEKKPQSVKGVMPCVNISFTNVKKVASTFEDNEAVKSHLTFGAEYDSVLEWFIETGVKTFSDIAVNSTNWGNYRNSCGATRRLLETGSNEVWRVNNIYDLAGNVSEWTQEYHPSIGWTLEGERAHFINHVGRGGTYGDNGDYFNVASRSFPGADTTQTGFRIALYLK